jgi:hypothetical protein
MVRFVRQRPAASGDDIALEFVQRNMIFYCDAQFLYIAVFAVIFQTFDTRTLEIAAEGTFAPPQPFLTGVFRLSEERCPAGDLAWLRRTSPPRRGSRPRAST